jgi:hypothetical protein
VLVGLPLMLKLVGDEKKKMKKVVKWLKNEIVPEE